MKRITLLLVAVAMVAGLVAGLELARHSAKLSHWLPGRESPEACREVIPARARRGRLFDADDARVEAAAQAGRQLAARVRANEAGNLAAVEDDDERGEQVDAEASP